MEELEPPREGVIIGHENVKYVVDGWTENPELQYHVYLTHEGVDLKDAAAIVYGESMLRNIQKKREVPLNDVNPLNMSDGKKDVEDKMYGNTITVEMTGEEQKNTAMEGMAELLNRWADWGEVGWKKCVTFILSSFVWLVSINLF